MWRILLVALFPIGLLQASRHCYHCTEWEWGQFCNTSATSFNCPTEESTCFTRVRYESGTLRSTKGCILKEDCQDFLADNADSCSKGIITSGICSYCCDHAEHCNYDRFAYSDTTPAPTTTTPMPIAPVTIPHSIPDLHCNASAAEDSLTTCMANYRGQIAWTLQNSLERFGEFCRHVPDVLHCVAVSLEACICLNDAAKPVAILTPALKLLAAQCPSQCNQTAGLQCIQHSQSRILGIVMRSSEFSCGVLYKEVTSGFQCVHFSVSSCSHSTFVSYNVTQSYSYSAIERLCPLSTPSTIPPGATLPGGGSLVQTGFPPEGSTATPIISSTRTTNAPVTEDPLCNIEAVNDCLSGLGHAVVQSRVEGLSFDNICLQLLPATSLCLSRHSESCSKELKQRFQFASDYIDNLMGAECLITTPAPVCDPTRARLCIVRQWELIEGDYSIQEACDAVMNTTECVRYNSQDCTVEEKSSLNTTLYNVLQLLGDKCVKDAAQCNNGTIIELEEGGSAHDIQFQFKKLPISLCDDEPDCEVTLKLEREYLDTNPRCLDGQQIPQFVIGRPHGKGSACSEVITSDNWGDIRKYKIAAKTDLKVDGNHEQKLRIVVKKVVGGQVVGSKILCVYTVRVIDKDTDAKSACTIWNDPHVLTFSQQRYNMHTEGWYQMYRHKTHPIEVQVGYQKCHSRATCICAVAVRAGDTVYFMDRCRKAGVKQCVFRCKKQLLKAQLFYNIEITPGFRMFTSDAGSRMDIQLPHGTVVTIKERNIYFSVIVNPSPVDFLATRGLCGDFGDDHAYILPNGTKFYPAPRVGKGDFFNAWRIPDEDILINGVARNPFRLPADYCDCLQGDDTCHDGTTNACGVCTTKCDDVTNLVPSVNLHNDTEQTQEEQSQQKTKASDYEFDYKFVGNESVLHPNWTEADAELFCLRKLVLKSPVVEQCLKVPGFDTHTQIDWCTQDVMITGDINWADSHLEALKIACEQSINANVDFYSNEEGANLTKVIYNLICPNECSGNGECDKGNCICRDGFSGEDCSVEENQKPEVYPLPNGGVCDVTGRTTCQNSFVFGDKFAGEEYCHVTSMDMAEQTSGDTTSIVSKARILTSQQLYCGVPISTTSVHSHTIRLSYAESSEKSTPLIYVVFNSICHDCQVLENSRVECSRQNTGCVIDGVCYEEGTMNADDQCLRCSNEDSSDSWTGVKTLRCRLHLVYIIVGVIAALILIVCITVCVCICCTKKEESPTSNYNSAPRSLSVVYVSNCSEPNSPVPIGSGFKDGSCSTQRLSNSGF